MTSYKSFGLENLPDDALQAAWRFNQTHKTGDTLRIMDPIGIGMEATLTGPARVLGTEVIVPVKEAPGLILLKFIVS